MKEPLQEDLGVKGLHGGSAGPRGAAADPWRLSPERKEIRGPECEGWSCSS